MLSTKPTPPTLFDIKRLANRATAEAMRRIQSSERTETKSRVLIRAQSQEGRVTVTNNYHVIKSYVHSSPHQQGIDLSVLTTMLSNLELPPGWLVSKVSLNTFNETLDLILIPSSPLSSTANLKET